MRIEITSNAAEILRKFDLLPESIQLAVVRAMDLQNQLTIGRSQANYLTGPRPQKLGVVTNRLRSSLRAAKAVASDREIVSSIGTNVRYAGVHEYGFNQMVTVRSHTRKESRRDVRAGGKEFDMATGRISQGKGGRVIASGISNVKSHQRKMRVTARPYIQPALRDRIPDYSAAISTAVVTAYESQ